MATGVWGATATTGTWTTAASWLSSIIANGSGFTANFTSNINNTSGVTLNTATNGTTWTGTIGSMTFSDAGASGGPWYLGSQATITLAGGGSTITTLTPTTIASILAGTSGFTKAGASTLKLSGQNIISGGITVNEGTLLLDDNSTSASGVITSGPAGTGTITFAAGTSGGAYNSSGGARTIANPITFLGNFTYPSAGANPLIHTGPVSFPAGGMTFTNANNTTVLFSGSANIAGRVILNNGSFILAGSNTGSGGIELNVSTLHLGSSTGLGTGTLNINLTTSAAVISNYAAGDLINTNNNPIVFSAGSGNNLAWTNYQGSAYTFDFGSGSIDLGTFARSFNTADGTTILRGVISNSGVAASAVALTTYGTTIGNKLALYGISTYVGRTSIQGPTALLVNNAQSLGAIPAVTTANQFTISNGGILRATSTFSFDAKQGINSFLNGMANLEAVSGVKLTLPQVLTGSSGGFNINSTTDTTTTGTIVLQATNTYSGGTNLNRGTLAIDGTGVLGSGVLTAATFAAGIDAYTTDRSITNAITFATASALTFTGTQNLTQTGGAITLLATPDITVNANTLSLGGIISGGFGITKLGSGTLVLTNASNAYTGTKTVNAGILLFSSGSLGPSGNITVNGGTLRWASGNTQDISSRLTFVNGGAATLDTNGNNVTLGTTFGGGTSGTLTKTGTGTLRMNTTNTYTGGTTVNTGTLELFGGTAYGSSAGSIGTGNLTIASGSTVATYTFFGISGIYQAGNTRTVNISGTLNISGSEYIRTFNLSGGSLIGPVNPAEYIRASTDGLAINSIASNISSSVTNKIDLTYSSLTVDTQLGGSATDLAIYGVISQNSGAGVLDKTVTKNGLGTLFLSASNTYAGGTIINSGTLSFTAGGLNNTGSIAINSGTLQWAAGNTLDVSSRLAFSNSGFAGFDTNGNNITLTNAIGGSTSTALAKVGSGTLTLSAAATYTGATNILTGTLSVNSTMAGGFYNGAVNIYPNTILSIVGTSNQTLSGILSGSGTLTKTGSGVLSLAGNSTFSGNIQLSGSTLRVGTSDNALGTSTLITSGSTAVLGISSGGGARSLSNNINIIGGTLSLDSTYANLTLNGNVTGSGLLQTTNIGTSSLGSAGSINSSISGLTIANNTTFTTSGSILITKTGASDNVGSAVSVAVKALNSNVATTIFNIAGGTTTLNIIGINGTVNISAGITTVSGGFYVSEGSNPANGNGIVNQTGGTLNLLDSSANTLLRIGHWANPNGINQYNLSGGTLNVLSGTLNVGWDSTGSFGISGGSTVANIKQLALGRTNSTNLANVFNIGDAVVSNSSGRLNIGSGGITKTSLGTINLGNGTIGAFSNWSSIANMVLTGSGPTFNTLDSVDNLTSRTITLSGTLSGPSGFTKTGGGILNLPVSNTFSGSIGINLGSVNISNATALGTNSIARSLQINEGQIGISSSLNYPLLTATISSSNSSYPVSVTGSNLTINLSKTILSSSATFYFGENTGTTDIQSDIAADSSGNYIFTALSNTSSRKTFSGVISGPLGFSVEGTTNPEIYISNPSSSYTGKTSLRGTTYISTIANTGVSSSLGAPINANSASIDMASGSSSATLYIAQTGSNSTNRPVNLNGTTGGVNIVLQNSGSTTFTSDFTTTGIGSKSISLSSLNSSGVLELQGNIVDSPNGNTSLIAGYQNGVGTVKLTGNRGYTGTTTLQNGTTVITSIANLGLSSSLGTPTDTVSGTISIGSASATATLVYSGGIATTNRIFDLAGTTGGAVIGANSTGTLTISNDISVSGAGSKTLTLSGSFSGSITGIIPNNSPTNKTSLNKTDSGTWTLLNSNTYSGDNTIAGGVLRVGNVNALGVSNSTSMSSGSVLELFGSKLAVSGSLNVDRGTLRITNGISVIEGSRAFVYAPTTNFNNIPFNVTLDPSLITSTGKYALIYSPLPLTNYAGTNTPVWTSNPSSRTASTSMDMISVNDVVYYAVVLTVV